MKRRRDLAAENKELRRTLAGLEWKHGFDLREARADELDHAADDAKAQLGVVSGTHVDVGVRARVFLRERARKIREG